MTTDSQRHWMSNIREGQMELLGYTEIRREPGLLEVAWTPPESFSNPMGFVHGGFVSVIIDEIGGSALGGTVSVPSAFPTISLHVDYLRGVPVGEVSTVVGRVLRIGRTVSFTEVEVVDANQQVCARGLVTYALKTDEADKALIGFASPPRR